MPYIVPCDSVASASGVDPHTLPDSVWRDPSLRGSRTVLATSNLDPNSGIVNVAIDNPDTESEDSESSQQAADRFVTAGHRFNSEARQDPVEAETEVLERRPEPPKASPAEKAKGQH